MIMDEFKNNIDNISELHDKAMDLAELAFLSKMRGEFDKADDFTKQALLFEIKASDLARVANTPEPTFSILHRSAASLAIDCKEFREAERLIAIALSFNPPTEIAEELRDLLEQVYYYRHLDIRGVTLTPDEFQLSIAGRGVGYGIAPFNKVFDRIKHIIRLISRTAERKLDKPFREKGRIGKKFEEYFEFHLTVPRAASYAMSFKIGRPKDQLSLPGFHFTSDVVDELLYCLELFKYSDELSLKKQIHDEAYYNNFIALSRQIAPDGDDIRFVGFTAIRGNKKKAVSLTKPKEECINTISKKTGDVFTIEGTLLFADSTKEKGKIKIIDQDGKDYSLIVPKGMMSDIVRPMWEYVVIASVMQTDKGIQLQDIKIGDE